MQIKEKRRKAPPGFDLQSWTQFMQDGILVIKNAVPLEFAERLNNVIDSYNIDGEFQNGGHKNNIVEIHPLFRDLINYDAHIGYVYDLYGESLKLLRSQFFIKPPNHLKKNDWHFDGPRVVPFDIFSEKLPLRIKVSYWLTDLPQGEMGNLIFIRGSHKTTYLKQYKTHETHEKEEFLIIIDLNEKLSTNYT